MNTWNYLKKTQIKKRSHYEAFFLNLQFSIINQLSNFTSEIYNIKNEKMNYGFFDFLKLIGSLGVFLFGMKMMSEALQKVAGDKMRHFLAAMTSTA